LFISKVCEVFQVGFDYFLDNEASNFSFEKVVKIKGGNVGCKIGTFNNNFPGGILENMLKRIENLEKEFLLLINCF
jgi:hypothetical protein